jgi:hypothetical protein
MPLLIVALGTSVARGQPEQAGARTVLAAVLNVQGRPIVDVSLDDFVVTEGGQPREVLDVHVADYPIAVVVDDRPEARDGMSTIRATARRFIQRVGERPVALFRLTEPGTPVTILDDERAAVLDRLGAIEARDEGSASPLETIARAAATLKDSGAPFSAVIVIAAAPIDAAAPVRGELLPQIIESGAAVHVVQARAAPAPGAGDPAEPDLLRLIADQTRGQCTAIFSTTSFDAALDRLADHATIVTIAGRSYRLGGRTLTSEVPLAQP